MRKTLLTTSASTVTKTTPSIIQACCCRKTIHGINTPVRNMHTIEIPDNKKTISIPEHWDECTPDQLAMILQRAYQVSAGIIDLNTFYIIVFAKLTGLKAGSRYHFLRRLAPRKFSDINATIFQLAQQLCAWPFAQAPQLDPDEPPRMELNYDTVKNLLTPIKAGGLTFYGPAGLLS